MHNCCSTFNRSICRRKFAQTEICILFNDFSTDVPIACYDGQVRITDNYTYSYNDFNRYMDEINGYLEICFNETFYPVCGQSDVDLNATEVVELACLQLGYDSNNLSMYLSFH